MRPLLLREIEDPYVQENFIRLKEAFVENPLLRGQWRFMELTFKGNLTAEAIPHRLGFIPTDVLQTALKGTGTLTWLYATFDEENVYVTTSGTSATDPLIVRAFIGRFMEGSSI